VRILSASRFDGSVTIHAMELNRLATAVLSECRKIVKNRRQDIYGIHAGFAVKPNKFISNINPQNTE
jgi:hypothetical protein